MPSRKPRRRFEDILDNIAAIRRHTAGLDFGAYSRSEIVVDAVERCLSRISEAAIKLDAQAEELAPGPQWDDIRGLGNWLRHSYDGVSTATIWAIVTDHLESLEIACRAAVESLPPDMP